MCFHCLLCRPDGVVCTLWFFSRICHEHDTLAKAAFYHLSSIQFRDTSGNLPWQSLCTNLLLSMFAHGAALEPWKRGGVYVLFLRNQCSFEPCSMLNILFTSYNLSRFSMTNVPAVNVPMVLPLWCSSGTIYYSLKKTGISWENRGCWCKKHVLPPGKLT